MTDTIVALSSGAPPSGVAVIRISGPATRDALLQLMAGEVPRPRMLTLRTIGANIDRGLVAWFPAPNSFTGEDAAELQVHGSPAVVRSLLRTLVALPGVRLATAGEFTRRAFENGKLDLAEAQGLGDLIRAETENQRAIAFARMAGGLSRKIEGWRERLLDLRAEIEAQLDFSDEGDVGELPPHFVEDVRSLASDVDALAATSEGGRILKDGFRVVLAGPPNAGKSSLLNALSQADIAIVSDEPGTTRDLKEVPLDLGGQLVILTDSAGIRATESKAEALGVARAETAIRAADLVLWLVAPDISAMPSSYLLEPVTEVMLIGTKSDVGAVTGVSMSVSAATGSGIDALLHCIEARAAERTVDRGEVLISHEQDRSALLEAGRALGEAIGAVDRPELAAEALRRASHVLERLLGRTDAEAVLDRLFLTFCIGK